MEYILSSTQMREIDARTSTEYGIDSFTLMERAALESAHFIIDNYKNKSICIFAGIGNNGGDGIALSRILWEFGFETILVIVGDINKASDLTKKQLNIISKYPINVTSNFSDALNCEVYVDSIFGIGLNREVSGTYKEAIEFINSLNKPVISLDIPSGINADTGNVMGIAVKATHTFTFGAKKTGQILYPGRDYCGHLHCFNIGIPVSLYKDKNVFIFNNKEKHFPDRRHDGNKGTFGKVLLIAGSKQMGGACILCGEAILRSGAGMLKIYTVKENRDLILNALPEAMVEVYDDDFDTLEDSINWADAVCVGPGLSTSDTSINLLTKLSEICTKPLVADADALNIISNDPLILKNMVKNSSTVILTPHLGEFSRLTGKSISEIKNNVIDISKNYAFDNNVILACKDACTVVSNGMDIYLNTSGNSGMATAGSGDVLTGIITSLLVQSKDAFFSACNGVYLHGVAGDIANANTSEYYIIAKDIIDSLAKI